MIFIGLFNVHEIVILARVYHLTWLLIWRYRASLHITCDYLLLLLLVATRLTSFASLWWSSCSCLTLRLRQVLSSAIHLRTSFYIAILVIIVSIPVTIALILVRVIGTEHFCWEHQVGVSIWLALWHLNPQFSHSQWDLFLIIFNCANNSVLFNIPKHVEFWSTIKWAVLKYLSLLSIDSETLILALILLN